MKVKEKTCSCISSPVPFKLIIELNTALIAKPGNHHFNPLRNKTPWHFYKRYAYLIKALGRTAAAALKMYMVIVVMALAAMAVAQGIFGRAIAAGYGMDNTLFSKNLQGAVNRYPVEVFELFFNISMLERPAFFFHKKVKYLAPAIRNTHVNAAEQLC